MLLRWLANWKRRHVRPVNLWLHAAGIPASFILAPVLLVLRMWWAAAGAFVGGYVLQAVGHILEGNRSGEEQLLRRLLGTRGRVQGKGNSDRQEHGTAADK